MKISKNNFIERTSQSRVRFNSVYLEADQDEFFTEFWGPVTELFRGNRSGAISVDNLIRQTFNLDRDKRPVVVIDLSGERSL